VPDRQLREKLLPGAVSRAGAAEPVDLGHGAFVITGNPFVSSLVLAAEPWASLAAKGPLWIAIPEQGTLLYASGEAGHKALPGLTLEVYSRSKHPLSIPVIVVTALPITIANGGSPRILACRRAAPRP
jgi:hypothetical protein